LKKYNKMKKIMIIIFLFVGFTASSQEWIKKDNKDYKLFKIDTVAGIVLSQGAYDIQFTQTDTLIIDKGEGLGAYWFYEGVKKSVDIDKKTQKKLKDKTYGKKDKI